MIHRAKLAQVAAMAIVMTSAMPAAAETGTGASTARVLLPLTVSESASLNFGAIVPSPSANGYVSVEPEGARSECTVASCTGSFAPASFTVTGSPDAVLTVSHAGLSTNPITFSLTSGANTMTFGLILHTPTITMDSTGIGSFEIGGRVLIPANQPEGDYSGTFNVNVDYQ